ncbi:acyltransferase domain-containing protein, partial [Frankia sp. R82]|uniref:acyltransferase domain-containing protein n=1 Tax=Frankia sp. R82 TaxID=2950553 RepID=UPI002044B5B6
AALATRTRFAHRAVAVAAHDDDLLAALDALADARTDPSVVTATAAAGTLAFLFSGQGSQRPRMGHDLYRTDPVYRAALDEVAAAFDPHLDRPLLSVLHADPDGPDAELIHHTSWTQPTLFALQVALYRTVVAHGVTPAHLIGHSLGEITAAHVAGVLTLADAARLVATRARLLGSLPAGGGMLTVHADEATTRALLDETRRGAHGGGAASDGLGDVDIAAVNSPTNTVLAGPTRALDVLATAADARGLRTRRLTVSHAFHSPLTEPILEEFHAAAAAVSYQSPTIPIISNVTGAPASPAELASPRYWTDHLRRTVRFTTGIATLAGLGVSTYLELGPDATLTTLTTQTLGRTSTADPVDGTARSTEFGAATSTDAVHTIATLRRSRPATATLPAALAALQVHGHLPAAGARPDPDAGSDVRADEGG